MSILESIKTSSVPPVAAKLQGRTTTSETYDEKNLLAVTPPPSPPFQGKVNIQPCLSFMPSAADHLLLDTEKEPGFKIASPGARMQREVEQYRQSLMYSAPHLTRELAVDILEILIKFDKSIDIEGSRTLCDAVNVIHRAEAAP